MEKNNIKDKFGKEYLIALDKVLKVRAKKREIYADSFLDDSVDFLLHTIDGKRKRFEFIRKSKKNFDKIEDEIVDIINYYLFVLCLLDKEKK